MKNNIIKVVEDYNTKFIDIAVIENNRAHEFTQSGTLINGNDLVYDENDVQYKLIDVIKVMLSSYYDIQILTATHVPRNRSKN